MHIMETEILEPKRTKNYINNNEASLPVRDKLFVDFIRDMVSKKNKSESYKSQYSVLADHINSFSKEMDCVIYTNSVNEEFLEDFIYFLKSKKMGVNTVKGLVDKSKSMARKAGSYGYAVNMTFDEVSIKEEESLSVALSMNDITRIYYYQGLKGTREKVRDIFIIGCLTGMRFSDYSTLTSANIRNGIIVKKTQKTGTMVHVPIHKYVKEIIDKYDVDFPRGISIQHFNRTIKDICKKIGMNEKVNFTRTVGHEIVNKTYELWQVVSSHTARRSAATNMYNSARMTTLQIMLITGHTTEKNFFRYIKVNREENAQSLSNDMFFRR